ncbi:MAG: hypothetical protein GXP55_12845 [Deltaproteobacteria bacterium]|nr:hypothetical protein [Deltaproteobacteria bacterium]
MTRGGDAFSEYAAHMQKTVLITFALLLAACNHESTNAAEPGQVAATSTPLSRREGLTIPDQGVTIPVVDPPTSAGEQPQPLEVVVNEDLSLRVDSQLTSLADVQERVRRDHPVVVIKRAANVPHSRVVEIVSALREAGAERFAINVNSE